MEKQWIQTVRGKVATNAMRYTSSHEHLITHATPEIAQDKPEMVLTDIEKISVDIQLFKEAQGNTIIDMTTIDYGRDVEKLAQLADKNNLNIVAATGFNKGSFNQRFLADKEPKEVAQTMIDEVNLGIGDTGIKPGVLKIGTSLDKIFPWEAIGLEAVAIAHLETGTPISTHTQAGTMAEEQLALFQQYGVAPENIVLCHLDQKPEFALHKKLLEKGCFLSYDSIPKPQYHTEDCSIDLIVQLAKIGLHKQIVVGGDFSRQGYYKGYGGTIGLDYNLTVFKDKLLVALEKAGLDKQISQDIFQENPKRAFCNRKGNE